MIKNKIKLSCRLFFLLFLCSTGFVLTSCFEDDETVEEKYKDWRLKNNQYLVEAENKSDENGNAYYTKIVPSWAPDGYVLIHWHNDRKLTANNLSPMDNSTVQIKYELYNIDDELISDSYSRTDSVYTSKPSQNIIGMWAAMTHMNVGDSVTLVIPSQSGYGERGQNPILPYSTLVYNVKMKAITAYEVP